MRKIFALAVAGMVGFAAQAAHAEGDAAKGEKVFKKCQACHTIEEGGKNKVGPNLWAIVGTSGAHVKDYKYSKGYMEAAPNLTWDEAALMEYLEDPTAYLTKMAGKKVRSKMTFKLKSEEQRKDVIAYLKTMQ